MLIHQLVVKETTNKDIGHLKLLLLVKFILQTDKHQKAQQQSLTPCLHPLQFRQEVVW